MDKKELLTTIDSLETTLKELAFVLVGLDEAASSDGEDMVDTLLSLAKQQRAHLVYLRALASGDDSTKDAT